MKFFLVALYGYGFDSNVVLNKLPQWRIVVNLTKNGAGIVSLKSFNCYVDQKKFLSMYILEVEKFILIRV